MKIQTAAFASVVALVAGASMGGVSTYSDNASFLVAADSVGVDSYELYGSQQSVASGPSSILLNSFSVLYEGSSDFGVSNDVQAQYGVRPLDGDFYLRATLGGGEMATVTFVFDTAITSFGTMINDVEIGGLNYSTNTGESGLAVAAGGNDVALFFGVVAAGEGFTEITFVMDQSSGSSSWDGVFFDQTMFSTATVPTPAGAALLGLFGLTGLRRRTR